MTTSVEVLRAGNIFEENAVLRVGALPDMSEVVLSAVTWSLTESPVQDAHVVGVEQAMEAIAGQSTAYKAYLLAAHSVPQPDTRIVRYRKLWSSLSARGLDVPGEDLCEFVLEVEGGLRGFGLRRLANDEIAKAVTVIEHERASFLMIAPRQSEGLLKKLTEKGWPDIEQKPLPEILVTVVETKAILLLLSGSFDDRTAGAIAIALPEALGELITRT